MELLDDLKRWLDGHRHLAMDLVRIYLGIGLMVMGVEFILERQALVGSLSASSISWSAGALAHLVILVHLGAGLMLTLGLYTRLAAAAFVPLVIGALLFVQGPASWVAVHTDFKFSLLILALLLALTVRGSGPLSVDHLLEESAPEPEPAAGSVN